MTHPRSITAVSGRNADQANQNVSTWGIDSSISPQIALDRLTQDAPGRTGLIVDDRIAIDREGQLLTVDVRYERARRTHIVTVRDGRGVD